MAISYVLRRWLIILILLSVAAKSVRTIDEKSEDTYEDAPHTSTSKMEAEQEQEQAKVDDENSPEAITTKGLPITASAETESSSVVGEGKQDSATVGVETVEHTTTGDDNAKQTAAATKEDVDGHDDSAAEGTTSSAHVVGDAKQESTTSSTDIIEDAKQASTTSSIDIAEDAKQVSMTSSTDIVDHVKQESTTKSTDIVSDAKQESTTSSTDVVEDAKEESTTSSTEIVDDAEKEPMTSPPDVDDSKQESTTLSAKIIEDAKKESTVSSADIVGDSTKDSITPTSAMIDTTTMSLAIKTDVQKDTEDSQSTPTESASDSTKEAGDTVSKIIKAEETHTADTSEKTTATSEEQTTGMMDSGAEESTAGPTQPADVVIKLDPFATNATSVTSTITTPVAVMSSDSFDAKNTTELTITEVGDDIVTKPVSNEVVSSLEGTTAAALLSNVSTAEVTTAAKPGMRTNESEEFITSSEQTTKHDGLSIMANESQSVTVAQSTDVLVTTQNVLIMRNQSDGENVTMTSVVQIIDDGALTTSVSANVTLSSVTATTNETETESKITTQDFEMTTLPVDVKFANDSSYENETLSADVSTTVSEIESVNTTTTIPATATSKVANESESANVTLYPEVTKTTDVSLLTTNVSESMNVSLLLPQTTSATINVSLTSNQSYSNDVTLYHEMTSIDVSTNESESANVTLYPEMTTTTPVYVSLAKNKSEGINVTEIWAETTDSVSTERNVTTSTPEVTLGMTGNTTTRGNISITTSSIIETTATAGTKKTFMIEFPGKCDLHDQQDKAEFGESLIDKLATLLNVPPYLLDISDITCGSIKVKMSIPAEKESRLQEAVQQGQVSVGKYVANSMSEVIQTTATPSTTDMVTTAPVIETSVSATTTIPAAFANTTLEATATTVPLTNTTTDTITMSFPFVITNTTIETNATTVPFVITDTTIEANATTVPFVITNTTTIEANATTVPFVITNTTIEANATTVPFVITNTTTIEANATTVPFVITNTTIEANATTVPFVISNTTIETNATTVPFVISNTTVEPNATTVPFVISNTTIETNATTVPVVITNTTIETNVTTVPFVITNATLEANATTVPFVITNTTIETNVTTVPVVITNTTIETNVTTVPVVIADTTLVTNVSLTTVPVTNASIVSDITVSTAMSVVTTKLPEEDSTLVFDGNCKDVMHNASTIAAFRKELSRILAEWLNVQDIDVGDIECGSIRVGLRLPADVMARLRQLVQDGNLTVAGYTASGLVDSQSSSSPTPPPLTTSVTTALATDTISAIPTTETALTTATESTTESTVELTQVDMEVTQPPSTRSVTESADKKALSKEEKIIVITVCAVGGVILLMALIYAFCHCCRRVRTASYDLGEDPSKADHVHLSKLGRSPPRYADDASKPSSPVIVAPNGNTTFKPDALMATDDAPILDDSPATLAVSSSGYANPSYDAQADDSPLSQASTAEYQPSVQPYPPVDSSRPTGSSDDHFSPF